MKETGRRKAGLKALAGPAGEPFGLKSNKYSGLRLNGRFFAVFGRIDGTGQALASLVKLNRS